MLCLKEFDIRTYSNTLCTYNIVNERFIYIYHTQYFALKIITSIALNTRFIGSRTKLSLNNSNREAIVAAILLL